MPYRTGSRGRGSFRRIFPAYMMILLLPILIGGRLFVRSFSILEDEIAKNRIHQLEVARDTVDTFIRELDSLILFIGRDPKLGVFS